MSNKQPTANAQLPDRLYGEHYPDSFLYVSGSIRDTNVSTLGDYIRHLQEVNQQPDQPCVACVAPESSFEHICPNNPILTCNCTDPKYCAELGSDPDNIDGNKRCPDSGRICNDRVCPNECLGDKDVTAKREGKVSGWPCVVVGAICKAWATATECVSRGKHSAGDTEQRIDARLNNDGLAATKGL
jgi:hypothetical protein